MINLEYIHDKFDENPDCTELQFNGTCRKCHHDVALVVKLVHGDDGNGAFDISGGALLQEDGMECDGCFAATEVYSRVVGYLRPKSQANPGKIKEMEDRKMFSLNTI